MLNVAWMQGSAADVTRYFAEADYYIDNNGGLWGGRDSASLGFKGEVDREHLKAMLNNRDASGQKITARDHATRRRGLEMTFSAPKSLSVMDAFGDTRIRSAFQKAVAITMNEVEQRAQRRVRDKGQDTTKTTGSLVYASFNHSLGRPVNGVPDMQMHSHVLIGNMTRDRETGKWYALEPGDIMKDAPYYQAFFRQTLAEQIQSLGYQLKVSKGDFEIKGVDKSILTKFSNRSKEVEAAAEKYGITRADSKAKLGAMTREKKSDNYSWEDLQGIWAGRLDAGELKQIRDTYVKALGMGDMREPHTKTHSIKHVFEAVDTLAYKTTYVTDYKVMTLALQKGLGKVSTDEIKQAIDTGVSTGQFIRRKRDPTRLTTREALLRDIQVKDMWKAGLGKFEKLGRDTYKVKAPGKPHLESLNKLYSIRDRYTSVRGNIGRNPAVARAAVDLNAGIVQDLNNLPKEQVWFVTKMDDGDTLELMKAAEERDARVVFWGDKIASRLEQDLNIKPVYMFDLKPEKPFVSRLKEFVTNLIRREYVEQESERSRSHTEYGG